MGASGAGSLSGEPYPLNHHWKCIGGSRRRSEATTVEGDPGRIDEVLGQIESEVLPLLKEQAGFKGFTVHVDRSSGKVVGTSYWESEEAMHASEEAVRGPREEAAQRGGAATGPTVEHFEVAIDTMV